MSLRPQGRAVPSRRLRGGKRSRMLGLLEYQLKLSVDKGLPLCRLLRQGTEARSPMSRGRREQEESASPFLRKRLEVEEKGQEGESPGMREDGEGKVRREEVGDTGELYSNQTKLFMLKILLPVTTPFPAKPHHLPTLSHRTGVLLHSPTSNLPTLHNRYCSVG